MKGSLIIIGFFVLGTLCGIFHLIPVDAVMDSKVSFYALCALMFSVGLSVGNDPQTLKNFRSLNPRLVFLPIMTILGTLAGSAAVSLILTHRSLTDCLAVGSGFGYYSLSSIFITEYKGAELGTIALLAKYQPRDTYPAGSTVTGTLVWQPGSHLCRRRHNDGYHTPDNHPYRRTAVCRSLHISRICSGFQRAVSGDLVLFDIGDYRQSAASDVEIRILS